MSSILFLMVFVLSSEMLLISLNSLAFIITTHCISSIDSSELQQGTYTG